MLARSVAKWNQACDIKLARLMTYINDGQETAVSHNSARLEIIYLDAGPRPKSIPALPMWDSVL